MPKNRRLSTLVNALQEVEGWESPRLIRLLGKPCKPLNR